jgi:4-oxalocrotonate tautomerase family enzyme
MPVAHINVLKGHPRPVLRQLIAEVSETLSRVIGAPMDRLEVWITEVDPELWGIAGTPAQDVLTEDSRPHLEMPFIQMVLLAGRPKEQHHRLIADITEVTARILKTDKDRIRLHIAEADPDSWGIGGVPASIRRAAEIKARSQ